MDKDYAVLALLWRSLPWHVRTKILLQACLYAWTKKARAWLALA